MVRELAAQGFPAAATCRVLKVSTSGFYEWRHRRPSLRDLEDAHLIHAFRDIHAGSRRTYGVRRCRAELRLGRQLAVAHKRARLMRIAGLQGVHRRRWRYHQPGTAVWEDRVQRRFHAGPTGCGSPTSPSTALPKDGCIALLSWTCTPGESWTGRSPTISAPSSSSK